MKQIKIYLNILNQICVVMDAHVSTLLKAEASGRYLEKLSAQLGCEILTKRGISISVICSNILGSEQWYGLLV